MLVKLVKSLVKQVDRFFTWSYTSEYNPLHHSGSLAVGLLTAVMVSGLYLIFFYSIGAPYESLQNIQEQWYLGRWIRSFHRYASDVTVVVVFYHIALMFSSGKSWGPRVLAWISGVALLASLLISGWTGFVMVWDEHGQLLAQEGAKLFQVFPFLKDDLIAAFSGQDKVPGSFFFMNLFLHVAIPLGMLLVLWIHTSKMSRIQLWPNKMVYRFLLASLILFSMLWSAPLLDEGSLTSVINRIPIDIYFGFFIPFSQKYSPLLSFLIVMICFALLLSVVYWTKPKKGKQKLSTAINDEYNCTGCTQCYQDCPYEAISMVPTKANRKGIAAKPDPDLCAMCGICAASCSELNIAPPEINGAIQINLAKEFCSKYADPEGVVVVGCSQNFTSDDEFDRVCKSKLGKISAVYPYPTGCSGQLHTYVVKQLLDHFKGVFIWTCPTRGCENREGPEILRNRLLGRNLPAFNVRSKNRDRVEIVNYSAYEVDHVQKSFTAYVKGEDLPVSTGFSFLQWTKKIAVTALLLFIIALGTRVPVGSDDPESLVRFNFLLPNLKQINCKKPSELQNTGKLIHMQSFELCEKQFLKYEISVKINDKIVLNESLPLNKGKHSKKRVYLDHPVVEGEYNADIQIRVKSETDEELDTHIFNQQIKAISGQVELISFGQGKFSLRESDSNGH